jgi:outer membrane protein assembly factor BamB
MAKTVNCPNCDAPLALDPSRPTLHCDYCKIDVTNPAHKSAIVGATPRKGKAGLIVGIAVGGVLVLGGGLVGWLMLGSDPLPLPAAPTETVSTSPATPPPAPKPAGPRIKQILSTKDLTGDGIGDLAFSSFDNPKVGGLEQGGLGLLDGKDGKLLWHKTYPTDSRAKGTRTACHGVLVVQDNTRSIIAFEGQSGAQRWRLTLSDYVRYSGAPAGTQERPACLFATIDRAINAVDVKAGKLLWRKEVKSPRGLMEVQAGADTVLLRRSKLALDLFSGEARETGIKESRRTPPLWRSSLVLAGAHGYHRLPRSRAKVNVHRAKDWKKLGQVKLPGTESPLSLYPQGGRLLVFNAFRPPVKLSLLDGTQLTGPVEVTADEKVLQARLVGETILMLTATYKGTRKTTLRAYDLELNALWNAQLDASGKTIKFNTSGPNFGGLGGRTSGSAKIAATEGLLMMELAPANQQARISVRDLRSGKVLGEITLPVAKRWERARLHWIRTGPKRAFVRANFSGDDITALDPATRKVVWTYAVR